MAEPNGTGAIAGNEELTRGYRHWCTRFGEQHAPHYPGTAYVLLHSLSHALMSEIALDCGYPASSLKERVYALSGPDGGLERCGILIYTATAGAQGTLGGLVETAPRFAQILEGALERSMICSNDPICADHQPDNRSGDRATHGAACHGCLLIAETSCEMRNLFLDRNLLVPTMAADGSAFFSLREASYGADLNRVLCAISASAAENVGEPHHAPIRRMPVPPGEGLVDRWDAA